MVTRREDEPGYEDMRNATRSAVISNRLMPDTASSIRTVPPAREKASDHSPAGDSKVSLFIDTPPVRSSHAATGPGAGPSILSLKMEIVGSITTTDELHIYGTVDGNVRAAALTICEGGSVKGDVAAETVVVQGAIEGRIFGKRVELRSTAQVRGDITHSGLGIDTSAGFEGYSKRSENPIAEAPAASKK